MKVNQKVIGGAAALGAALVLVLVRPWSWHGSSDQHPILVKQSVPTASRGSTLPAGQQQDNSETIADIRSKSIGGAMQSGLDNLKTAEQKTRLRDPFQFIEVRWPQGLPYKDATELVDSNQLPRLIKALEDPVHANQWSNIAILIGFLGKDAESAHAILKYVPSARLAVTKP